MPFDNPQNFWTNTNTPVDPKRNFRFRVSLFGQGIWWARDVDQPAATVSEATHDFMTHKFYYPSKVTWNEVNMTLVDPVTPGTLDQLLLTLQTTGYILPSDPNDQIAYSSISKPDAVAALADGGAVTIEVLNAVGAPLHQWTLNNAFIKSVAPSQLSYTNEELMTVALGIRYDWASYQSLNNELPDADLGTGLFKV